MKEDINENETKPISQYPINQRKTKLEL